MSGGEPRIHPELESILRYYSRLVDEIIIITNAYRLTVKEAKRLCEVGATGFTVSLDSIDSKESFLTRHTPPYLHGQILENIEKISHKPRDFEFGINAVVSHVTANWKTIKSLLDFGHRIGVDFIKFQPIFDDSYVSKNAPDLLLSNKDTRSLVEIASKLDSMVHPPTNPPEFWTDVARVVKGKPISGCGCGLDSKHAISIRGNLSMCYWVGSSSYGMSAETTSRDELSRIQENFKKEKKRCKVGLYCFCNQRMDHTWLK